MELAPERVGPYVRALAAGLDALAPNDDQPPLAACRAHLAALDPVLSGELLLPAEVVDRTGMPAFPWMERALAEQVLARGRADADDPSDDALARAEALDRALGRRMRDRRSLHRHLRQVALLPTTRLEAAVRRLGRTTDVAIRYDRMAPDGRWVRIRAELSAGAPVREVGPFVVDDHGRVHADEALQHLLTRHSATPLVSLRAQLADATGMDVTRLGRGSVGPFWFPGVPLPDDVPAALGAGLLLHLAHEVVGVDVRQAAHLDPWLPPADGEVAPDGQRIFRERRFAASPPILGAVRRWADARGVRAVVVPLGAPRRRAL